MKVDFVKMHGAGNDFIMIDDRNGRFKGDWRLLSAMAARGTGIGCEGVILVQNAEGEADFRMRFYNPDGSEAELCGNGARCVAAFAREIGAAASDIMRFETLAGVVEAEIKSEKLVCVKMPDPKLFADGFVNSGVPHKVVMVENLAKVDVDAEGRRIRMSDEFAPSGTNVDFVTFRAPDRVSVRTYERGVEAETGACGTGAVAAAVVGVAECGLSFPVRVSTACGYELLVGGAYEDGRFCNVTLSGPVKKVFTGSIDLDTLDMLGE